MRFMVLMISQGYETAGTGLKPGQRSRLDVDWIVRLKSRDEAIEWASRCPAAENEVFEIR